MSVKKEYRIVHRLDNDFDDPKIFYMSSDHVIFSEPYSFGEKVMTVDSFWLVYKKAPLK